MSYYTNCHTSLSTYSEISASICNWRLITNLQSLLNPPNITVFRRRCPGSYGSEVRRTRRAGSKNYFILFNRVAGVELIPLLLPVLRLAGLLVL